MNYSFNDKAIVELFVSHLRKNGYNNLKIDRIPDKENRDSTDIDAIAGSFAIEHTSVDTVKNQRRDSDWFMQAVGGLKEELSPNLTYRMKITIPYDGIQHGQNWTEINKSMRKWFIQSASGLPDGIHFINNVSGIPFQFNVRKTSSRRGGIFFSRYAPQDNLLSSRLHDQLVKKAGKLEPYQKQNYSTILLVESEDIALMNENIMIEAIRKGFSKSLPLGVDKLWYVDTAITDDILFYDFTEDIIAT